MKLSTGARNRQWIYRKRPVARVTSEHYELREVDISEELAANEVLIEARYLSVDPYMRIQQAERNTWEAPHPLNQVQGGAVIGQVSRSRCDSFSQGDWVLSYTGWQTHAVCHGGELQKIDATLGPVTTALGVLGMPGRTAWFGLMEAGRPKPGETVVVSGAAGAVGSLVVQFAKRAGCRVIGLAGGPEKCAFVTKQLGADEAIDYRAFKTSGDLSAELLRHSGGVDVYFDNVGGEITDAVLPLIKLRARIVVCGVISQYEGGLDSPSSGPRFLHHLLFQRAQIQGILARDYSHRMDELRQIVSPWVKSKQIVFAETIIDGFDKLPEALNSLFEGKNTGKLIVRV
jgi:NADPH-dependent curcumin reductase CurA